MYVCIIYHGKSFELWNGYLRKGPRCISVNTAAHLRLFRGVISNDGRVLFRCLQWRFPKSWKYPQLSSIEMGFSLVNHPAMGVSLFQEIHEINHPARKGYPQGCRKAPNLCCCFFVPKASKS